MAPEEPFGPSSPQMVFTSMCLCVCVSVFDNVCTGQCLCLHFPTAGWIHFPLLVSEPLCIPAGEPDWSDCTKEVPDYGGQVHKVPALETLSPVSQWSAGLQMGSSCCQILFYS